MSSPTIQLLQYDREPPLEYAEFSFKFSMTTSILGVAHVGLRAYHMLLYSDHWPVNFGVREIFNFELSYSDIVFRVTTRTLFFG